MVSFRLMAGVYILIVLCSFIMFLATGAAIHRFSRFYRRAVSDNVGRYQSIDGLRGFLALAVFMDHAQETREFFETGRFDLPTVTFFRMLGDSAVVFFFLITAFLFWSKAIAANGKIRALPLYRGRVFRIVPMYLFSVVAVLVIAFQHIGIPSDSASIRNAVLMLFGGVFIWQPIGGFPVRQVNAGVEWTLAYEWLFYFLLPFVAILARRPTSWIRLVLFAAVAILIRHRFSSITRMGYGRLVIFMIGVLIATALSRTRRKDAFRSLPATLACAAIIIVIPFTASSGFAMFAILLASVAFLFIAGGNDIFGLLALPSARILGAISYSLYLTHGIVLFLFRPLLARTYDNAPAYWATIAGIGVITIVACSFTYYLIEHPFIEWGRRIRLPRLNSANPPTASLSDELMKSAP